MSLPKPTLWCLFVGELKVTGSPWEGMNSMKDWHLHLLVSVKHSTHNYEVILTSEGFALKQAPFPAVDKPWLRAGFWLRLFFGRLSGFKTVWGSCYSLSFAL